MNDLEGLSREFEKSLRLRYFKETTIKETMRQLADFIHCLSVCHGVREAEAVTREMIEAYQVRLYEHINSMGRPNGIACQNMTLGIVKRFMKFLKRNDYIVSDPAADISYARLPRRLPAGILSISEMRRILHAPDTKTLLGYRDRTMFEVLYSTGVRRSELGKLTLNDVDYHDGFLRINQGKGGKDRVVPLGRIACRYL
ncbi:MAG: tyrosine-type recombinase/integrase, partial [Pseudomonadota bacterium]